MKREILISSLAVLLLLSFSVNGIAANKFMLSISANYLAPADSQYKDIYGSSIIYPEFKIGLKVFMGMYIWGGFGLFSANGTTPVLEREAKSNQTWLSGGVGYMSKILPKLSYKLEAGVFNVNYKEEAMGEEFSDSAAGFRIDGGVVFNVTKKFFVEVSVGYLTASDTVIDDGEEYSIKLGGFRTGAGIGIRL